MMPPLHVRSLHPVVEEGWESLRKVRNECRAFMTGDGGEITPDKQTQFRAGFHRLVQRAYLISDEDWCPIAFLYLRQTDGRWVPTYGVIEEWRGRGVGTFLVEFSQALVPELWLQVRRDNWVAIHTYERAGFVPYDETAEDIYMKWRKA